MRPSRWMVYIVLCLFYAATLQAAEVRKLGTNDIEVMTDGVATKTSPQGKTVTKFSNQVSSPVSADVRDYGASTSASTSANRIAIQNAIDNAAAASPKKTVYFAELYQTDAAVTVSTTNLTLKGANNQCGIWNRGTGKAIVFTHGYNTMEDIYIKGNNAADPGYDNAASGIEVNASAEAQVYFHNVISGYHKGDGLRIIGGVYEITIDKSCVFASNSGHGVNTVSVVGNGNHTSVYNSALSNNLKSGLAWGGGNQLNASGNIFQSNGEYGIFIDATLDTSAVAILGNYFEDDALGHIYASVASGKTLKGIEIGGANDFIIGTATAGDNVYAAVKFAGAGTVSQFVYSPSNKDPGQDVIDGGGILDSTCYIPPTLLSNPTGDDFTGGYELKNWGSAQTSGKYTWLGVPAKTRACMTGAFVNDNTHRYECVTSGNWQRVVNDNTY